MLRPISLIVGLVLLAAGIMGFIPQFVEGGNLLGIFRVNFEHNIAHITSGILGILCGLYSRNASRLFLIAFGIVYAALAVIGFTQDADMILGMIANNHADNLLHAAIAVVCLWVGFRNK